LGMDILKGNISDKKSHIATSYLVADGFLNTAN